jgi:TrpR-related protein YerC/YecD
MSYFDTMPGAERLIAALLNLKSEADCRAFLEDICTIKELQDISQRLELAFMLDEGKNYQEISKATGASTATISRVKKCLVYGSGGYRRALDTAKEKGDAQ